MARNAGTPRPHRRDDAPLNSRRVFSARQQQHQREEQAARRRAGGSAYDRTGVRQTASYQADDRRYARTAQRAGYAGSQLDPARFGRVEASGGFLPTEDERRHAARAAAHPREFAGAGRRGGTAGYGGGSGRGGRAGRHGAAPRRRRGLPVRALLIVAAVLVVLGGVGVLAWTHRPVEIFVNDARRTYSVGTSLADVYAKEGVEVSAGDLVSVSGNVLEAGKGDPWSAKVDDRDLSYDDAGDYRIAGGETVVFGDGADRMEEYTTTTEEVQPKMRFEGSWGNVTYVSQWGKVERKEVRTGKQSGETADGDILQEGQDCVITTKNVEPADGQKLVALTFDDGPSDYTERYLEILEEHGAVATFFNLGQNVEAYPELAKKITDSGNQLCSHTQSHDQLTTDTPDRVLSEVTTSFTAIEDATGTSTTTIRPPYGAIDSSVWLASQGTMSASILWNMDSLDWELPGPDVIVSNSIEGIQPGYIILMHDGGGNRDQDLEALPRIIDELHDQGYTFVTVADLMASDPDIPEDVARGDATMPEDAVWPTEVATD